MGGRSKVIKVELEAIKINAITINETWDSLSEKEQNKITNEVWPFVYSYQDGASMKLTGLHLVALFKYYEAKLSETSELILTELWASLEEVDEAIDIIKKTNIKELCNVIKNRLEDLPDDRNT